MTDQPKNFPEFYVTAPQPCPYLPGRLERKLFTHLTHDKPPSVVDNLLRTGFRRSQSIVYKPACDGCRACVPVRIRVADFVPSRTQRKIASRNKDLTVRAQGPLATAEQYALFRRYQRSRHSESGMASMDFGDYQDMIEDTTVDTAVVEFRHTDGRLMGACQSDKMGDGFSLCYSFFDPDEPRLDLTHLPTFAIDDEGNQDPDDAVGVEALEGGLTRLWVTRPG